MEIDSGNPEYCELQGIAYSELGQNEEGIKCYERAVGIRPEYESAWNNMGNAYSKLGKYEEEIKCYERAIELNPNFHDAYGSLGWVYYKTGEYKKSIEASQKGLKINSDAHWILSNLALALLHIDDLESAKLEYERFISSVTQVAFLEAAIIDLEEALVKTPNLRGAKEILSALIQTREKFSETQT